MPTDSSTRIIEKAGSSGALPGHTDGSNESTDTNIIKENARCRPDEALDILFTTEHAVRFVTPEENARVVKKIDRFLMPIMISIYFLQYMDKQTISFASVFGIADDAHLVGSQYSLLGSVVYIAQLVLQPLSSFFLVKFRLSLYIPIVVVCWGATLACMSVAHNFTGLLIARFFLGGFEMSITSAFVLMGQIWYRRQEQGFRIAVWYSNVGWVNIFGSLITYGLGHIKSHKYHSYQIIFLLLGVVTSSVGLLCFFVFPDNPVKSKFLTVEDKIIAIERIRANQQGLETKEFKLHQAVEMILDLKSWCWMIMMFLISMPVGGIATFGPLMLQGFGFDGYTVMLLNIPFGALQVIFIFSAFWAARALRMKSPVLLITLIPCIIGSSMLLGIEHNVQNKSLLLVAYYVLSSYTAISPIILNWHSTNVAGHTKKATTTAFMNMGTVSGNIVGPLLFSLADGPTYRKGLSAVLASFCACGLVVCMTVVYIVHLNRRNGRRRVAAGKRANITDYSMLTVQEAAVVRASESMEGNAQTPATGMSAFEDLTDLQNDEFIYVY